MSVTHKAVLAIPTEIDAWLRSQTQVHAVSGWTDGHLQAEVERLRVENAELRSRLIAVAPDLQEAIQDGNLSEIADGVAREASKKNSTAA